MGVPFPADSEDEREVIFVKEAFSNRGYFQIFLGPPGDDPGLAKRSTGTGTGLSGLTG